LKIEAKSAATRSAELDSLLAELYARSGAAKFAIECDHFVAIVEEIIVKQLPADAGQAAQRAFCANLRVEELTLARACAAGNEFAWEVFLTRYREKLYDIAAYITKESSAARELADSLYADLYGTSLRDGERVSKFVFYTGRGSLEGWLRTVMAQEFVNRYRKQRRFVSLDEESEEGAQFAATEPKPVVAVDPRVEVAIVDALGALSVDDRFVLACYYLDGRTLAEIGRMLKVHESTISRKLEKLAKSLRKQILAGLTQRGLSRRQAQEAMEVDVRDLKVNLGAHLAQDGPPKAFSKQKAEAGKG
jgi:RNA polymerase sigma-70 factor, ECF subfamily